MRKTGQAAIFVLGVGLCSSVATVAEARLPPESPRYGPAYRRGLQVEASVGLSLCQPTLTYRSSCARSSLGPPAPGFALRVGGGWRFSPHWQLGAAWVRQGHRPGGGYVSGVSNGGMLAARGILPLPKRDGGDSRFELGLELGLGWSSRALQRATEPLRQSSSGALARPALIFDVWLLADFAIGLELATQLNFHWQYCVDQLCQPRPGDWVPALAEGRWVDGLSLGVRVVGSIFPRL